MIHSTKASKSLWSVGQSLIRPMLFIALGLHAFALFFPLTSPKVAQETSRETKEKAVRITRLQPSELKKSEANSLANIDATGPSSIVVARPQPKLPEVKPTKTTPPQPKQVTKSQRATRSPQPSQNPFADFPHFQPSTVGCAFNPALGDQCRVANGNLATVARHFTSTLPAKKFELSLIEQQADQQIFRIKQGKENLFLHLFKDGQQTVYLLAPEKVANLSLLKQAIALPTKELNGLLNLVNDASAGSNDATPLDFAEPGAFYTNLTSINPEQDAAIFASPKVLTGQPAAQIYPKLASYLQQNGFKIQPAGTHGNGNLYEIKKGSFTGFLNLPLASDRTGTVVVLWTSKP